MRHPLPCGGWIETVGADVRIVRLHGDRFDVLDIGGEALHGLLVAAQCATMNQPGRVWRRAKWRRAGGIR